MSRRIVSSSLVQILHRARLTGRSASVSAARSHRLHRLTSLLAAALAAGAVIAVVTASGGTGSSFETGTEPLTTLECAHPSTQFTRVTSPVREGSYAAKFTETGADVWSNGSVRCLAANYSSGETTGNDYYYHLSIFIPSNGISSNLIWELHHPSSLYTLPHGCGVAPFALHTDGTRLKFRIATGDCTDPNHGWAYWEPNIVIPGLDPYPRNTWIDFVFHIKFAESATGTVEVYSRTGSNAWPSSPQIRRTGIPTMPYSSATNVHNARLYWELGLYPGYTGYQGNDTLYVDDFRRETSLSSAMGGTPAPQPAPAPAPTTPAPTTPAPTTPAPTTPTPTTPAPTPTTPAPTTPAPDAGGIRTAFTYTSSIGAGATLTGKETWTVSTSNPAAAEVEFYADNRLFSTQPVSGGKASTALALTSASTSGGYHVYNANGALLYRSPSIGWTVAGGTGATPSPSPAPTPAPPSAPAPAPAGMKPAKLSYVSSIAGGAKLTGKETWTITTTDPAAVKVEFYADNKLFSTQPVSGGKASATLALTSASTSGGFHVYDASGAMLYRSPSIRWTVAGGAPPPTATAPVPAGTRAATLSYLSSIAGGAKLTGHETWTITTTDPAAVKVEFYADNKVIATQPVSNGKASTTLALTPASTSGGFHVYDASGKLLYRSPSFGWTVSGAGTAPTSTISPAHGG
jgi:hypothetical protein